MTAIVLKSQALKWEKRWKDRRKRWYRKWEAQLDRALREIVIELKGRVDFDQWTWEDSKKDELELLIIAVLRKFGGKYGLTTEQVGSFITLVITEGILFQGSERGELKSKVDSSGRRMYWKQ